MKPRAAAALPTHTGYSLKVLYGVHTEPQEVDGRVKAIILALMRLETEPPRLLDIIALLLAEREEMGLERATVRGVSFDWGSGWFNWDVQQGKRRQESEAA